ncbi:MAG: 2-amino-4-hydroxy-6-hydroxymethyldihydropteridine diphosphokinase, partial [Mariprofundaceae bacterium]|nr:2-amino-4-hydroxy-6-hydroxymethyldihydropteridine diphosphokinase [Mariprofundaceae bacterium]
LGGNLGRIEETFSSARSMLAGDDNISLLKSSRLYRSSPMGPQDQPDYLNAALLVSTALSPLLLLRRLQAIELDHGRNRETRRWGERTLDLDLIAYDHVQMTTEELILPHPGTTERLFVLQPLCDIQPHWQHPATGMRADALLQQLIHNGASQLAEGVIW